MTCAKFETAIGYHCSPVLMGMKPANLVSFSKEKLPDLPELVSSYKEGLEQEGIHMNIICGCRKHYLLLLYRPDMLERFLAQDEAKELLIQDGYPENGILEEMLDHLKERFAERKEFPHEIGLFLGYPIEDVKGFRQYKGNDCKLCGYWKVYGDADRAREIFAGYDRCREFISAQIQQGYSILQVVGMRHQCAFQSAH
nr:DUF3793 family protein [uncultured Blautia sp.]